MRRILFTCVLILLAVAGASAQDPNQEYWRGFNDYNSFQLGSFESINQDQFIPVLHIPIVSYPQKGSLPELSVKVWWKPGSWYQKEVSLPTGGSYYEWWPIILGAPQQYTSNSCGGGLEKISEGPGLPYYYQGLATCPDGSIHNLYTTSGTVLSGTQIAPDASEWQLNTATELGPQNYLTDKNGIKYYSTWGTAGSIVTSDPAGNAITYGTDNNSLIDSVGRKIPLYCPNPNIPSTCTINYPGLNGGTYPVTYTFAQYSISTTFDEQTIREYSATTTLMQSITLPNGTSWNFSYNNFGDLVSITTPLGGSVSYTWTTQCYSDGAGTCARILASRSVNANDGSRTKTWTYDQVQPAGPNGTSYPGFTDPDGNITAYTTELVLYDGMMRVPETVQYYQFTATGQPQTLLKTLYTHHTYGYGPSGMAGTPAIINLLPQYTTTTLPNGQSTEVSQVTFTYDSGATFYDGNYPPGYEGWNSYPLVYGSLLQKQETDYGSGAPGNLLRDTATQYEWQVNSSYLTAGMFARPASVTVYDSTNNTCKGQSNPCAQTTYAYDETGNGSVCTALPCGNLTSETHWLSTGGSPKTQYVYNSQGMKTKKCDPIDLSCSNPTLYTYDGSGLFLSEIQYPGTGTVAHVESFNYDLNTGRLNWQKEQNNQQTTYTYDPIWRPKTVSYPDGGSESYTYNDTVSYPGSPSFTYTRKITSSSNFVATGIVDGLGRDIRLFTTNGETTPYDQVDTCYDAEGRVGFKSYPYQGNGTSAPRVCSGAGDAFAYDALNRATQVTHSDGSTVLTSYTGRATSVQDEGNGSTRVQRISQADGLGRLTSLCEISGNLTVGISGSQTASPCNLDIGGTGFLTTYAYDALSNLTSVSQGPLNSRTFAYDSLSRLTQATNPESGTICYGTVSGSTCQQNGYDADGNLIYKTDARNITTTYSYDQLNRILSKSYSDGTTPSYYYNYDVSPSWASGLQNLVGRLVLSTNSYEGVAGKGVMTIYSYDPVGRTLWQLQQTPNIAPNGYWVEYTYDLAGDLATLQNGLGQSLTYAVNAGQRVTSVSTNATAFGPAGPLFGTATGPAHYNAAGSLLSATLGNGISETRAYDGRLRLNGITDGSIYTLSIPASGGYAPNDDVLAANDSVNGNWTYGYDAFNRLTSANATGQAYTYVYDRFGNRWQQNGPHSSQPGFNANNQMIPGLGVTYDAAGNETSDGVTTYTYDAESRITKAVNPTTGTSTYVYDADGKRVEKTTAAGGTVDFLYDVAGHEVAQINPSSTWARGEVYLEGRHLATLKNNTTYYNHADWLGTERARSTSTGTLSESCTSLPFGDWLTCAGGDPSPMHFTGKEHDPESNLDDFGARYYSSQYGRFVSADWSAVPEPVPYAHLTNPQTLNLYAIVQDNPETFADLDGHDDDVPFYWKANAMNMGENPLAYSSNSPSNTSSPAQNQNQNQSNSSQSNQPNQPNQPNSQQPQQPSPPSWDKTKPLPSDPSKLGPDWRKNPNDKNPNGQEYINDKTGEKIEWNKGRPGPWPANSDRGKDGWHYTPPGGERGKQLDPGQVVTRIGIAAGAAALIHAIIESAPAWGPALAGGL